MSAIIKAGGLLEQYKLLGAVIDTTWATRLDHKVIRHVIDRYYPKYGQGRVSLRYLEKATGTGRGHIIESLRRITDKGVIKLERKGLGTRPSEYSLNFNFGEKLPSGVLESTSTRGVLEDTPCGVPDDTATVARGAQEDTESYLRNRSTDRSTVNRTDGTPAVPTAPLVAGLTPASADSAVVPKETAPFEELWSVFPRKHERSKARAEYDKLAPDKTLHTVLVARAILLAEHYTAAGTEKKYWKHMHNWIREERYLEDLPEPYEKFKQAAIANAKKRSPKTEQSELVAEHDVGLSPKTPVGGHSVEIIDSEVDNADGGVGDSTVRFNFRILDGKHAGREFSHKFYLWCESDDARESGQQFFSDIGKATGVLEPNDTSDLHGKTLRAIVSKGARIRYE